MAKQPKKRTLAERLRDFADFLEAPLFAATGEAPRADRLLDAAILHGRFRRGERGRTRNSSSCESLSAIEMRHGMTPEKGVM